MELKTKEKEKHISNAIDISHVIPIFVVVEKNIVEKMCQIYDS